MTTPSASIPLVSTIFGLTYLALALGKVPGLRIDRAGIALVGAAAMLACGVLSMHDAARAVDYETIVLLFGMMVVVSYLRMAGFFALATERIAARFSGPSDPAGGDDRPLGRPLGVPGQRRRLRRPDAAGAPPLPAAEAAADPLPGRPGDGLEHRLGRDDHGQPAEHHHRLAFAHLLPAVRRAAGPRGRDRPGLELRRRGAGLPQGAGRGGADPADRPTSRRGPGSIAAS